MNNNKRAFSLVELMIVITLITIIAGMSMWFCNTMNRVTARMELETLYVTCLYLRSRAQSSGTKHILHIDSTSGSYSHDTHSHVLANNVQFSTQKSIMGPPAYPMRPINKACTFEHNCIHFNPEGTVQSGSLYLQDTLSGKLYALTNAVSSYSFFRKYEYDNGWRLLE